MKIYHCKLLIGQDVVSQNIFAEKVRFQSSHVVFTDSNEEIIASFPIERTFVLNVEKLDDEDLEF
jgi:hypothetical protein